MLTIVENKQLIEHVFEYDVILIGTSIMNALGNGFQYQIKINFPEVDKANKSTKYGDLRKLGTVKVVNSNPIFCLLYISKGGYRKDIKPEYIDYSALEETMKLINENFKGKKIASTIIGLNQYEGGGDRDKILNIIQHNSENIELFLYDCEQYDYAKERDSRWKKIVSQIGEIEHDEYEKLKKQFFWQNAFGIYKPIPYDMSVYEIKQYIKQKKGE